MLALYAAWAKLGFITPIGPTIDPHPIAHEIAELNGQNRIMSLAFDRRRINDLKRELDAIGCQVPLESHGQGAPWSICRVSGCPEEVTPQGTPSPAVVRCQRVVTRDPAGGRKVDKAKSSACRWRSSRPRNPSIEALIG